MEAKIRSEQPGDHAEIEEVNRLAFGKDEEARLVSKLRQADGFDPELSLVAIHGGAVVGHILFSAIRLEENLEAVPALALAPMAVLPELQRLGIGSQWVRRGLDSCRRAGHTIVVVLGHPKYYPRFGFAPARRHGYAPAMVNSYR